MLLIDTHCHLDVADFDLDRAQILERCRDHGITRLIVPAIDAPGWGNLAALCQSHPMLFPAYGLHPVYIHAHRDADLESLKLHLVYHRALAVGEIGLDFYIPDTDKARQVAIFEQQLHIARDADLPVVLHVRKAHDEVLRILKKIRVKGGTCHAFNGSMQQARDYIQLGFMLGFGGMLTYPHSSKLRKLAKELPLDAIVLETDAPDMTVASHHGQRNSPEYLPECLQALAEVRNESPEVVADVTTKNAERVFNFNLDFNPDMALTVSV